ncbi:MAG TPA: type II secretion system inner membrane protein GspF [Candidatus Competibacteraceae bacterium]|nr:type II secretion system inner membrane protein GspF [Candidatus Competibacteraceae bacterium]
MPLFRYQAVDAAGEVQYGEMDAPSQAALIDRLRDQGLLPLAAEETRPGQISAGSALAALRRRRVSTKAVALFTQQLANLLGAGLPLDRALSVLIGVAEDEPVAKLLARIQDKVRGGASLADAMEAQHGVFSRLYLNMIRAGEAGGSLELVLERLSDFMERSQALKESVTSALVYPIILLCVAAVSVIVLLTWVVPQFEELFADAGKALPLSTQIVIAAGEALRGYWWAGAGAVFLLVVWFQRQLAHPDSRYRWDALFLRLPLFGELVAKVEMARFSRTLGTLLGNGVAMLAALAIVKETLTNQVMAQAVASLSENLKAGQGLAEPLMETGVFPRMAVHMIRVGEETGRLETMLVRVADTYDREVQATVKRLLALLEPVLILGLGVVIAGIIMSILVAIMGLNDLAV